jgi:hypothetical protein
MDVLNNTALMLMEKFPCRNFIQMTNNPNKKYFALERILTVEEYVLHVSGAKTFGGGPNIGGECSWCSIDIDERFDSQCSAIIRRAQQIGFTQCNFLSEHYQDRGHIYCVFDLPVKAQIVHRFLQHITAGMVVELFAGNRNAIRFPGGFHQIKKIWPEFTGDCSAASPQEALGKALLSLRPINAVTFKQTAQRHEWEAPHITIDAIKKHVKITDVARILEIPSKNGKWKCLFHDDNNVYNLQLYDETATFFCFSSRCKKSGDLFNLVAKAKNITNSDAIRWVQERFGIQGILSLPCTEKQGIDKVIFEIRVRNKLDKFIKPSGERVLRLMWDFRGTHDWFFISFDEIARQTNLTKKTVQRAIDRLRWCRLIESLPYSAVPSKSRRTLQEGKRACRYYRLPSLVIEFDSAEKQAIQMLYTREWLHTKMVNEDQKLENEKIFSQGEVITIPETSRILGTDRSTAEKRIRLLELSGYLIRLPLPGACNSKEWRNLHKNKASLGNTPKVPLIFIPPCNQLKGYLGQNHKLITQIA